MDIQINKIAKQFTGHLLQMSGFAQKGGMRVLIYKRFQWAFDLPEWAGHASSARYCFVEIWCAHGDEFFVKKSPRHSGQGANRAPLMGWVSTEGGVGLWGIDAAHHAASFGARCERSGQIFQKSFGRSSWRVTLPSVARSIASAYSGLGIRSE